MGNVTAIAFEVNSGRNRAVLLVNTLGVAVSVSGEWPTASLRTSYLTMYAVDPDNGHGTVPTLEANVSISPLNGAWKVTMQPFAVAVVDDASG